jgi:flagellar protein FlaG
MLPDLNSSNALLDAKLTLPIPKTINNNVDGVSIGSPIKSNSSLNTTDIGVPIVVEHKPIELKIDIEKMRASLEESISKINDLLRDGGRSLSFNIDEKLGGLVVTVKNTDTGEIIRQIPSHDLVHLANNIEVFKGLIHNKTI